MPDASVASITSTTDKSGELFAQTGMSFTGNREVKNKKMGINAEIVVSIGPETSNELRKNGINPLIEADNHTLSGMLESLLDYLFRGGNFGKDKRS